MAGDRINRHRKKVGEIGIMTHVFPNGKILKIPLLGALWSETPKNLSYIQKRKELGERATKELGVQCWG